MTCLSYSAINGCHNGQPIVIHHGYDGQGLPAVWYADNAGNVVATATPANVTIGACAGATERNVCVTMAVVSPATVGEKWNVQQRIAVDGTISYWNMDVAVPVDVTAQVASFNSDGKCPCETTGVGAVVPTTLTKTIKRLGVQYTVAAGYKSLSITALSSSVTIDTVPIPNGFTWSVDGSDGEVFLATVALAGSDYIVTEVR
jgi:hypothetical protein